MESNAKLLAVIDWLIRIYAPNWLRTAGLIEPADYLSNRHEFTQFSDIEPGLDDVRGIAALSMKLSDADSASPSTGLLCRDVARAAASLAVWSSGWPQVVKIAWNTDFNEESSRVWHPIWSSTRAITRHCSRLAARGYAAPIVGLAGIDGNKWAEAHETVRAALLPVVAGLRASARDLIFKISE